MGTDADWDDGYGECKPLTVSENVFFWIADGLGLLCLCGVFASIIRWG